MQTTAQEIYSQVIRDLSPNERLRLATLTLNELVGQPLTTIDISDTWTDEDRIDLMNFSLQCKFSPVGWVEPCETQHLRG